MADTSTTTEPAIKTPPARPRKAVLALLGLLIVALAAALVITNSRATLLTGPMVQIPAPDTLTFAWQMNSPVADGYVRLTTPDGRVLDQRADQIGSRFEASFSGLKPGASYTYVVQQSILFYRHTVAGPFETQTPASRGRPFRFIAFGDSGNGSNTQTALADRIAAAKPDVVIHVGDLVYPSGEPGDYAANFFVPNAGFIRSAPFMASLGNHDVATDKGKPLLDVFVLPQNGPVGIEPERNYYFDWGDARFIALDSNPTEEDGVITAEQRRDIIAPWARKAFTDCNASWKFAFFHHPFYTGSEHPAEGGKHMKEPYLKVFEECGVNMVFCGHNHLYERTSPIRGDRVVPDGQGIVYITTGAGGVSRYPEDAAAPRYITKYNSEVFSFTQVDLTADRLELKQIDENGKTIDAYTINKPPPPPK